MQTNNKNQSGFTLVEIIVSTAIFVAVVSALLTLFNTTLQINRRVQTLRELVQGTRAFTETVTREVRNGRIDYTSWNNDSNCRAENYDEPSNQSLAIESKTGDKICFYLTGEGILNIKKQSVGGDIEEPIFSSSRFKVDPASFRFRVFPKHDPNPFGGPPYPGVQPFVTILAKFELEGTADSPGATINYQTTISTDVYDTYKQY